MALTDLESGTTVGDRYRVERFLGQGELGCTYVCRDLMEAETPVALRILTGWDGSAGATALRQELSFLGRLKHPHLAHLLDFGVTGHDSTPYLVRHFVEGVDFFRGSEGWSIDQILHYLVRLCRVLQYLHSRGAVHRHLKPSNVMLTGGAGSEPELKVLDFGLDRKMKRSRRNLPVLAYTAPEILLGHSQNPRADLYSLGILAYQLLTRRLPFDDEDEGYLIQKHLQGKADMRPIERLERGAGLAQVLLALLEKDPEKRPSSAEDVIRLVSAASGRDYSGTVSESVEAYFTAGPFVGREKEMACLQERATRVRESSRGCTVFLTGESGSGKSRCLEELRTWALLEGWRVVEAACLPREDRSYGPYRRILARASVLRPAQSDDLGEKAIFRFDDASRLAESPQIELSSGSAAGPFRDLLTREVVRLLAGRPTLLFLHDFHWADEATVAVLDYLTSDILAHPIFMCVSLRPGETEQGPLRRLMELSVRQLRAETLSLEALPPQAIEDLIAGITGQASLGREIGSWVHKASGGNPFFVEEILKHLIDRALLRRELGKWRLSTERFENVEVPSSVAVVLRHRLAQLSAGAAALTEWLALFRRAVSKEELRALSSLSSEELEARLRELILRQIIREVSGGSDGCFEFRHALISEVITEDLPTGRRRRMHQKIGQVLEQQFGDQENLQELATHFMEGKCVGKAMNYALRAAKACKAEFANESALRFYEYALGNKRFLSADQLCEVAIDAADTYCAVGNPKRAIQILSTMIPPKSTQASWEPEARKLGQLALCYQHLGHLRALRMTCSRGLHLLGKRNSACAKTLRASFLKQLSYCAMMKSHSREALTLSKRAYEAISGVGELLLQGQIYMLISAHQRIACDLHAAMSAAKNAIGILEPIKALPILCGAYSHLGISQAGLGRFRKARESHEKAIIISDRTRSPLLRSQALGNLAECLCRSGQLREAHDVAAKANRLVDEFNNPAIRHSAAATLAEINLALGHYRDAQVILEQLNSSDSIDLPVYSKAHVRYLSAWMWYQLGDYAAAIANLNAMVRIESNEAPVYERELGEVLRARILHLNGDTLSALQLLQSINTSLIRKRWPFHQCLVQITIAEILLENGEVAYALRCVRNALRLAGAMSCVQLQAYAHLIRGRARIQECCVGAPGNSSLLEVRSEFQQGLKLAETAGAKDLVWRIHAALADVTELLDDCDACLMHSVKTLESLEVLTAHIPDRLVEEFRGQPAQRAIRAKCQERIQRFQMKGVTPLLSISEMEEEHLRMLFRVSSLINSIRDLNQLMDAIVNLLAKAVGMERILIALREEKTGGFRMARKMNLEVDSLDAMDPLSQQVLHEVARSGSPFVTANARCDPRITSKELTGSYAGTLFCAPLTACGRMMGLLYADHRVSRESLSESTINLFAAFCNLAAVAIDNALVHRRLMQEKSELEQYVRQVTGEYPELVGKSAAMQKLRERIALAAASPLDVLIYGESGTGKELVARALHRTGRRAAGKFVALDCGSLSDSLVESELFGYRKGAFTGAVENRAGLLEAADGGVIFLDEISNLSLRLQRKLLRVLQEREVRRIGETAARRINVQVIAATNKNLRQEIRAGRFRKDLYFRLNAMEINVPPLRDRTEDVPLLLEWFLDQVGRNEGGRTKALSQEAHALLVRYSYPGNVRELKNIVEGSYYSTPGDIIEIGHLPAAVRDGEGEAASWEPAPAAWQVFKRIRDGQGRFDDLVKTPFLERQIGSGQVRQVIHLALAETGGSYRDAFRLLGIPAREYAIMIQFLKRNRCYLDFRPYRKSRH